MELNLREHQLKVIDSLREGFKQGHRTQQLRPVALLESLSKRVDNFELMLAKV